MARKIDLRSRKALAERERLIKKYGEDAGAIASEVRPRNIIPTPSMALDYTLGTGGWVRGTMVEAYGPPEIGKSTVLGAGTMRNVVNMGLLGGIIAMEPYIDADWLESNGVDPDYVIIGRPDDGEDAFEMLRDWVFGGVIDFILFDSIGAVVGEGEIAADSKARQGGQSGLISWGVKRVAPKVYKNDTLVMFINQQRDDQKARIAGMVEAPGGWAIKHHCSQRIHLKPGKDRFMTKVEGEELLVGRELVASIKKNKLAEGLGNSARFKFFHVHTPDYPFGVDLAEDVLNTAKRCGVIESGGAWLRHASFPDGKLNGKAKVAEFFAENPDSVEEIRKEVLEKMYQAQEEKKRRREEKLADAEVEVDEEPEEESAA